MFQRYFLLLPLIYSPHYLKVQKQQVGLDILKCILHVKILLSQHITVTFSKVKFEKCLEG